MSTTPIELVPLKPYGDALDANLPRRAAWGRVTYEMLARYWPTVPRRNAEAPPAMRGWAVKLDAKPKYVMSSTRYDFPWTNSRHIADDLRTSVQQLRDATPDGVPSA